MCLCFVFLLGRPGDLPCGSIPWVAAGAGLGRSPAPLEHLTPPAAFAAVAPARSVVLGLHGHSADRALGLMPPVLVIPPTRRPDVLAVGVRAGAPQPPPSHVLVVVVKRHAEKPAVPEVGKEQRELHEAQHRLEVGRRGRPVDPRIPGRVDGVDAACGTTRQLVRGLSVRRQYTWADLVGFGSVVAIGVRISMGTQVGSAFHESG